MIRLSVSDMWIDSYLLLTDVIKFKCLKICPSSSLVKYMYILESRISDACSVLEAG